MRLSSVRNVDRMRQITEIAVKHGFGYFFERHNLRNLMPRLHRESRERRPGRRGLHIRLMLEEMGPTFIKFGQLLSTRPDVIPEDILIELRKLQDEVRPFPVEQAYQTIESELKLTVRQLFLEFDETPIAAASIGQVHRAVLPNGDPVIVKVQRPDAEGLVKADIDMLYQFAHLLSDHTRQEILVDPVGVVDQFARGIRGELDYRIEARNAERFAQLFDLDRSVHIPKVYWQYSTTRVLTLEYLEGVQLVDLDTESITMSERRALAALIADCWLKQVFIHGFFHGDPHPANILVARDGTIGLVDFGITGVLTADDRQNVISLFVDITNQNVEKIPRRLEALGVEFPRELEPQFVSELRDLFAKYFNARLSELEPVSVFRDIFGAIFRLKLKLPSQYLLLDKAIATLEGITSQLYPSFNVLEFARPYAREFVSKRYSPVNLAARGAREAQNYMGLLMDFPYQVHEALEQVRTGDVRINFVHRNLEDFSRRLTILTNRLVISIVLASLILGSSIIGLFAQGGPRLLGISVFALFGFMISGFFGLWLVGGILRSGRH